MIFRKKSARTSDRPLSVCDAGCRAEAIRDRILTSAAERLRI